MHIGGSSQFSAIGAVDSPVIRDSYTDKPMIPGSSFKGKMRTLLAKQYFRTAMLQEHNADPEIVLRLFGSSNKNAIRPSRLLFSDMFLLNEQELKAVGIDSVTEVKCYVLYFVQLRIAKVKPSRKVPLISTSLIINELLTNTYFSKKLYTFIIVTV